METPSRRRQPRGYTPRDLTSSHSQGGRVQPRVEGPGQGTRGLPHVPDRYRLPKIRWLAPRFTSPVLTGILLDPSTLSATTLPPDTGLDLSVPSVVCPLLTPCDNQPCRILTPSVLDLSNTFTTRSSSETLITKNGVSLKSHRQQPSQCPATATAATRTPGSTSA